MERDDAEQTTDTTTPVATPMATAARNPEPVGSDAVPIASLTPLQPVPRTSSLRAVVALIYPYSSATDTLALLLTEPDFRLRLQRGQVRVQFRGPAARAVAGARVGIGDAITLNLRGGKWVENSGVGTPGRGVEGELVFKNFVQVEVVRDGQMFASVNLDEAETLDEELEVGIGTDLGRDPVTQTPLSRRVKTTVDQNAEHASPAFLRGKRVGSGGFSVAAVDPFVDVVSRGGEQTPSKRRKAWRFVEKSESPEADENKTPREKEQEQTGPVVVVDDSEDHLQRMVPTTPTPAPVMSRRDAKPAPLVTTDLLPESQLAPPLSTPRFKIPTTPPAPPSLRPVQSPALPLPSTFSSIPPPEGFPLSLMVAKKGEVPSETTEVTGTQQTLWQGESPDYFGAVSQSQQLPGDMPMSDFVNFETDGHIISESQSASLNSGEAVIDLTEEPTPAPVSGVENIASAVTMPMLEDHIFDYAGVGQAQASEGLDEFVDFSQMQDSNEQLTVVPDEETPVQTNEQGRKFTTAQQSRALPYEITSLPSPTREPAATQDTTFKNDLLLSNPQVPLDATTSQETLLTPVPIPLLPTPASSQNRLLEMVASLGARRDTTGVDGKRDEQQQEEEDVRDQEQDLTQPPPPITPLPTKQTSTTRKSDVPEILSPWFSSSRRSSRHSKRAEEQSIITTTTKTDAKQLASKDHTALAVKTRHDLEQQLNKFASGLRTRLSYFTPLASLQSHLNTLSPHANTVDVLALVSSKSSLPDRAKRGPRDFYTTIHVADQTRMSNPVSVQILRPRKISLPAATRGDVILLRNVMVKSRKSECILVSGEASAWCVWRLEGSSAAADSSQADPEDAGAFSPDIEQVASTEECRGPPVEVDDEERMHVLALRYWWSENEGSVPDVVQEAANR